MVVGQAPTDRSRPGRRLGCTARRRGDDGRGATSGHPVRHRRPYFAADQVDAARDEILALNLGRPLPDGTTYRGGGFPAGWDVDRARRRHRRRPGRASTDAGRSGGRAAAMSSPMASRTGRSARTHLPSELGREPTPQEVLERTEAAIAYNAPLLGYDDPKMLHTGDVVYVDAATLAARRRRCRTAAASGGHVVVDGESYWSISEAHLPSELGREPTGREIYDRTEAAIAYNAPLLGYDDPNMLHPGDVVYVDAATLWLAAPPPSATGPGRVEPAVAGPRRPPVDRRCAAGRAPFTGRRRRCSVDAADRDTTCRRQRPVAGSRHRQPRQPRTFLPAAGDGRTACATRR